MTEPSAAARREAVRPHVLVSTCLYALAAAGAVWVTMRPVFLPAGSGLDRYGSVVAVGIAVGIAAGAIPVLLRRGPWLVAGLATAGYLVAAVGIAIPAATAGGGQALLRGVGAALRAPVTGWKDVVTLPVPLGEFGATLAVPLALLVASCAAIVWLGTRPRRWGWAAGVGGAAMVVSVALGPAARTDLAGLPGPISSLARETVVGLLALASTLGWVLWRMADERRAAVAATGGGVRGVQPRRRLGRALVAGALVAGAVVTAGVIAVPIMDDRPRDVARTAVTPRLAVDQAVSPMSAYRAYFSDDLYDAPLFAVANVTGDVTRIRVATLPYYDGSTFSAVAPEGYTPLRFQHLPSAIPVAAGTTVTATIAIDALEGPWVPLPGELGSVTLSGPRGSMLTDAFYYASSASAAVLALEGGVAAGDTVAVTAAAPPRTTLEEAGPSPGAAAIDRDLIPESLSRWVADQGVTRDGAGLATLVERLRAQGYLSHSLALDGAPRWVSDLGDYTFEPSTAGHSYDRIDRLFEALLDLAAEADGEDDAEPVAAVGDDEQFAAATALVAAELGFPARVVVGARLVATDPLGWTPAPCDGGVCRGGNLSVWTEVQAASGEWIPVDVTPQHEDPVTPAVIDQRDPELPTATDPDQAEAVDAIAALKGRSGGSEATPAADASGTWFTGWVRTAVLVSLVLLVLLGPLAAILVAKGLRSARRRAGPPTHAAQGAWDEYVDAGVDAGLTPTTHATRLETAAAFGTRNGFALAVIADRATFTDGGVAEDDARRAWQLVATDRAALRDRRGRWRRLGTRLSTRSLLGRATAPRGDERPRPEHGDERWRTIAPLTHSSSVRRRRWRW